MRRNPFGHLRMGEAHLGMLPCLPPSAPGTFQTQPTLMAIAAQEICQERGKEEMEEREETKIIHPGSTQSWSHTSSMSSFACGHHAWKLVHGHVDMCVVLPRPQQSMRLKLRRKVHPARACVRVLLRTKSM
jgi:hypothetical protein